MSEITRTMQGLNPATRYVVRVRKHNAFNIQSEWSEALEITTSDIDPKPEEPTDLEVNWDSSDLILRWRPPTANINETKLDDLLGYRIVLTDNVNNGAAVPSKEYLVQDNSFVFFLSENQLYFNRSYDLDVDIYSQRATGIESEFSLSSNVINLAPEEPLDTFEVTQRESGLEMTWDYQEMPLDFLYIALEATIDPEGTWLPVAQIHGLTFFHCVTSNQETYYRYRVRDVFGRYSVYSTVFGPYLWF